MGSVMAQQCGGTASLLNDMYAACGPLSMASTEGVNSMFLHVLDKGALAILSPSILSHASPKVSLLARPNTHARVVTINVPALPLDVPDVYHPLNPFPHKAKA